MGANGIGQAESPAVTEYAAAQQTSPVTTGKTIGSPKLSEKAQKYYEQLREKFSHMDFVLVSEDKKAEAQANASRYANPNRMVVLIDTEKIERMAADEQYRKKYESIISSSSVKMTQMKSSLGSMASSVKTFGLLLDDGGNASFFAVIDKSLAAQRQRIKKNAQSKAAESKKAAKNAEEKRAEERRNEKNVDAGAVRDGDEEDTVTVTASTIDELVRKVQDVLYSARADMLQTDEEKSVGQKFNFSV